MKMNGNILINATAELPLQKEKLFRGKQKGICSDSMKKIILFSFEYILNILITRKLQIL